MVRKILLVVLLILAIYSLAGCQTIKGVGRDIEWTGEKGAELVGQEGQE
jgi:predicted small secreted protein